MNEVLRLEIELGAVETEFDRLLEQMIKCREQQFRVRGELRRARRLEREELQNAKRKS